MKCFFKFIALGLIAATPTAVHAKITLVNTTPQQVSASVLPGNTNVEPKTKRDNTFKSMKKPSESNGTAKKPQANTASLKLTNKTDVAMRVVKASGKKGYMYTKRQVLFTVKPNESITIPTDILKQTDAGLEFDSTAYAVKFFSEFKMTAGSYNVIMGERTDGSATFKEVRVEQVTEEAFKSMKKPSEANGTAKKPQANTASLKLTNKTDVAMRVVKARGKKGYMYTKRQVLFTVKPNESITIPTDILKQTDAGLEFDSTAYVVRFFSEFKMTAGSYNVIMGERTDGSATFKEVRVEQVTK